MQAGYVLQLRKCYNPWRPNLGPQELRFPMSPTPFMIWPMPTWHQAKLPTGNSPPNVPEYWDSSHNKQKHLATIRRYSRQGSTSWKKKVPLELSHSPFSSIANLFSFKLKMLGLLTDFLRWGLRLTLSYSLIILRLKDVWVFLSECMSILKVLIWIQLTSWRIMEKIMDLSLLKTLESSRFKWLVIRFQAQEFMKLTDIYSEL